MTLCRTATHAGASFAKHGRTFVAILAVICAAGVRPLPCEGQTFTVNGNNWSTPAAINVGIGTPSPAYPLDAAGTIRSQGGAAGFIFAPRTGSGVSFEWYNPTGADARLWSSTNGDIFTVTPTGAVGVGTASATSSISVVGGGSSGGTNDPSLVYNAGNTLQFASGVPGVALAGGVLTASPNSFWLQVRSSNATGLSYPLALNPLGGAVGIGTTNPVGSLTVTGDGPVSTNYSGLNQLFVTGKTNTNQRLALGYDTASNLGLIQAYVNGGSVVPLVLQSAGGAVGIGTTSPCTTQAPANCKLSVAGAIQAKEVVVNTGWSDYVFAPTYRLKPLPEIAAYIARNHHLPGIPSEAEVRENGVSLGDMQSKLLAKVEELTLHMIQSEERNTRLEQQNRELQERVARLEGRPAPQDHH